MLIISDSLHGGHNRHAAHIGQHVRDQTANGVITMTNGQVWFRIETLGIRIHTDNNAFSYWCELCSDTISTSPDWDSDCFTKSGELDVGGKTGGQAASHGRRSMYTLHHTASPWASLEMSAYSSIQKYINFMRSAFLPCLLTHTDKHTRMHTLQYHTPKNYAQSYPPEVTSTPPNCK